MAKKNSAKKTKNTTIATPWSEVGWIVFMILLASLLMFMLFYCKEKFQLETLQKEEADNNCIM